MTLLAAIGLGYLLLLIDFAQTLRIAREPQRWRESWNVALPEHPSAPQVCLWFAVVAMLAGVALWLLPDLRMVIAILGCVVEGSCVVNNIRKGIRP